MRWVPELGLSAILLANVTYAKCEGPLRRALALVAREAALPRRPIRADPGLLAAREAVDGLVATLGRRRRRPPVLAERRSRPPAAPSDAPSSRSCASATARWRATASIEPEDALRGRWRLRGERGHVDLAITMAPTVPPLVQTLDVESVLPPAGLLACSRRPSPISRASRGATRSRRCWHPASTPRRRCAACASQPRSTAPSATASRSRATARRRTTLRLPGARGDVELELALDAASGRPRPPRPAPARRRPARERRWSPRVAGRRVDRRERNAGSTRRHRAIWRTPCASRAGEHAAPQARLIRPPARSPTARPRTSRCRRAGRRARAARARRCSSRCRASSRRRPRPARGGRRRRAAASSSAGRWRRCRSRARRPRRARATDRAAMPIAPAA